jgi:hypothetical protein
MIQRPSSLIILSLALVIIAFSLPIQIMLLFEYNLLELKTVFSKLTALNQAVFFALLGSAFCVYHARIETLPMALITNLLVAWNNHVVGIFEINYSLSTTIFASLGFLSLHSLLFFPSAKSVILDPKLRWWKLPERRLAKVEIQIQRLNGESYLAHSYDLSSGGLFISFFSVHNYSYHSHCPPLIPNDSECVMLSFKINATDVVCQAKVVRKANARGSYPAGIGLEFIGLKQKEARLIRRYIKNAPKKLPPRPDEKI